MNETLEIRQGTSILTIERRFSHAPEKVWRFLVEVEQLNMWYPFKTVSLEPRLGGKIVFDEGSGMMVEATIDAFEAPKLFAFTGRSSAREPVQRERLNVIRIELRPEASGCLMIFKQEFIDRPAAASYAAGWTGCLDALDAQLAGREPEQDDSFVRRFESFVTSFGLDQGSAAQTPNGWEVRFDRQLMKQSKEKVWSALTGLTDLEIGGQVPPDLTVERFQAGAITALDPPNLIEFEWRYSNKPVGTIRWELTIGPGGARIELRQTGPSKLADQQPIALTAWRDHIAHFVRHLMDGRTNEVELGSSKFETHSG